MNPFQLNEISWEDPILHICYFLPGKDILNLAKVDKSFNKIITESKTTMAKTRLVVKVGLNDLQLDDVIKLAEKREFGGIKVVGVNKSFTQHDKISKLLSTLGSVEDIIIKKCQFEENQLRELIQAVLPKVKRCELYEVELTNNGKLIDFEPLEQCGTDHPLELLKIVKSAAGVLKFFVDCHKLKSFEQSGLSTDEEPFNAFLAQQAQLKKLKFYCFKFDWSCLTCFALEELTTGYLDWEDSAEDFSKFLKKLPSLKKLGIFMFRLSRRLMEAICSAPKLESLIIIVQRLPDAPTQDAPDVMVAPDGLFNNTIKKLRIHDDFGVTGCLVKVFRGVESVTVISNFKSLDLSDVSYETIEKINLKVGKIVEFQTSHIEFSPAVVPENVERFESVVLGFVEKCSTKVHGITIGNDTWLSNSYFRLSNSFCERIVNALPQLKALQLFNIADRPRFESFLTANRTDLADFELHEPFEDDFLNKLMNIELN